MNTLLLSAQILAVTVLFAAPTLSRADEKKQEPPKRKLFDNNTFEQDVAILFNLDKPAPSAEERKKNRAGIGAIEGMAGLSGAVLGEANRFVFGTLTGMSVEEKELLEDIRRLSGSVEKSRRTLKDFEVAQEAYVLKQRQTDGYIFQKEHRTGLQIEIDYRAELHRYAVSDKIRLKSRIEELRKKYPIRKGQLFAGYLMIDGITRAGLEMQGIKTGPSALLTLVGQLGQEASWRSLKSLERDMETRRPQEAQNSDAAKTQNAKSVDYFTSDAFQPAH